MEKLVPDVQNSKNTNGEHSLSTYFVPGLASRTWHVWTQNLWVGNVLARSGNLPQGILLANIQIKMTNLGILVWTTTGGLVLFIEGGMEKLKEHSGRENELGEKVVVEWTIYSSQWRE